MSNNPFGNAPPNPYGNNPYAAGPYVPPGSPGYGWQPPDKEHAKSQLRIPAIALIVLAVPTAILRVGFIVFMLQQAGAAEETPPLLLPAIVGHGLPLLLLIAVMAGCFQMLRVESYSSALTAAIISVLPFCSPGLVLGIPFGIWAIVVLNNPRVKAAFQ